MEPLKFASHDDEILYYRMVDFARKTQGTDREILPMFFRHDGTVAVEKMRGLPMFAEMDRS